MQTSKSDATSDDSKPSLPQQPLTSAMAEATAFGPLHRAESPSVETIAVPKVLQDGVPMLKVSAKKVQQRNVRLTAEEGQILWESRTGGVVNIENIIELRFGKETRPFREQFGLSVTSQDRWTTLIYTTQAKRIKTLHLVALTQDVFQAWKSTLSLLYKQRRTLMGGLDQMRRRQSVWLKQQWKTADENGNERLCFPEVVHLCKRLGISVKQQDLQDNFKVCHFASWFRAMLRPPH